MITLCTYNLGDTTSLLSTSNFEPELTLRQSRRRLNLIHPQWPSFPNGVGIILGDFNICDPEEGRLNVWNQTFTDGDARKTAVFHSFFAHVLEVAQSGYTRRDSTALGVIRSLSRLDRFFINLPMAEHESSIVILMSSRTWGLGTIPSDHTAVRLVIQKPTTRGHMSKRIPSWMSKDPVFCSLVQRLHDDHGFSPDPSCALAEFKVLLNKAKKLTTRVKVCKIMLLKENRDGFYKAFSDVPLFVVLEQVAKRSSLCHRCTSAFFLPGKKGIATSAIFFCQEKGYCQDHPGDFNGTAWRCRSRNNLSTFDEVFSDCALPTPPGPTPLW